jgi:hypothetical protein
MRYLSAIALLIVLPIFLAAEDFRERDPQSLTSNLVAESPRQADAHVLSTRQIVRDSALIFSGTVLTVEHLGAGPNCSQGITRISFRVQSAIRGVRSGRVIQIREWGGLWSVGERYQPGETVMLFLYPNSKLGLTSPVGGSAGRFRVNKSGHVQIGSVNDFRKSGALPRSNINVRDFAAAIRRAARE